MNDYTLEDALKSLAESGTCPMTPPIMGELIEAGYFEARMNGVSGKDFYEDWKRKQAQKTTQKRILAVRHADGVTEFECPDCGNYMIVCDTTRNIFSHGEVSETGSEYLFCQKCGAEHGFSEVEAYEKTLRGMLAKRMAQDPQVEF